MSICLLDTTVFCNIVPVPGRDQHRGEVVAGLRTHVEDQATLLLPMAAIIETGNHVGRCQDGTVRRQTAARFIELVKQAIRGEAPFTPTPFFEAEQLHDWLDHFPNVAMQGLGLADYSIVKEFQRQCALHPSRVVFIWSLDQHLAGYAQAGS